MSDLNIDEGAGRMGVENEGVEHPRDCTVCGGLYDTQMGATVHYDGCAAIAAMPRPTPAQEQGWQPIETAPRDGTAILGYGPLPGCNADEHGWQGVRETKWKCYPEGSPGYAAYERGDGPLGLGWDWYESVHNWSHTWKPTHWMPLPTPPSNGGQG